MDFNRRRIMFFQRIRKNPIFFDFLAENFYMGKTFDFPCKIARFFLPFNMSFSFEKVLITRFILITHVNTGKHSQTRYGSNKSQSKWQSTKDLTVYTPLQSAITVFLSAPSLLLLFLRDRTWHTAP